MNVKSRLLTSGNPKAEIWRFLRYFLHGPTIETLIQEIQSVKGYEADVKKQAEQIAYSIRQAEEYFKASDNVSLITRPLLLYYGIATLSRALVLLKRNGEYSLDYLRKKRKHKHHGLSHDDFDNLPSKSVGDFFGKIYCKVNTKDNTRLA
jgi:site-specific DNA-adenine methylase